MKVIIVEDDDYKANQLKKYLEENQNQVLICRSFKSGIREIVKTEANLILLDMTIPTFEITAKNVTSRTRKYGGRDILNEMQRKSIDLPVIVVTQYNVFGDGEKSLSDLDQELREKFSKIYYGCVFYNASVLSWQDDLDGLMTEVREKKKC